MSVEYSGSTGELKGIQVVLYAFVGFVGIIRYSMDGLHMCVLGVYGVFCL